MSLVLLLLIIIGGIGYIHVYYRKHSLKNFPVIDNNYVERVQ